MSLYADGCQKNSLARQSGSAGNVDLLSVGRSGFEHTSSQAGCASCLTPHRLPRGLVLKRVIEDLFTVAKESNRDVDPDGLPIRIFIDTVAMMGNLHHAAAFTDVLEPSMKTI